VWFPAGPQIGADGYSFTEKRSNTSACRERAFGGSEVSNGELIAGLKYSTTNDRERHQVSASKINPFHTFESDWGTNTAL